MFFICWSHVSDYTERLNPQSDKKIQLLDKFSEVNSTCPYEFLLLIVEVQGMEILK